MCFAVYIIPLIFIITPFVCRRLQDAYLQALKALLSTTSNEGPSESNQRKLHVHVHANLQESIQGLWNRARLFQKAIPFFEGTGIITVHTCAVGLTNTYM